MITESYKIYQIETLEKYEEGVEKLISLDLKGIENCFASENEAKDCIKSINEQYAAYVILKVYRNIDEEIDK